MSRMRIGTGPGLALCCLLLCTLASAQIKENVEIVTRDLFDWEKGLIGAAVVVVIVIVGCSVCILQCILCLIIRKRIFGCLDRTWRNCSAIIGISNEQQAPVDNGQRAETILYSRRPVQERGDQPPGSAIRRGSQDAVEKSDVQHGAPQIFPNLMGQREEGANYNIRVPVCVELPVVTSHGSTQPDDGSCIRDSATVYLPPMHTKPAAVLNTTTVLFDGTHSKPPTSLCW